MGSEEFFDKPRSWSLLKHKILIYYFREYFQKVNRFYKHSAVVADLFAGTGKFENGEDGSPLILSYHAKQAAIVTGYKNTVYVAETNPKNLAALTLNLQEYLRDGTAKILEGDARQAGLELLNVLPDETPFVMFLDPFGLKGLSMDLMEKIFARVKHQSMEILINYNEPALTRHFGRIKNDSGSRNSEVSKMILRYAVGESQELEKIFSELANEEMDFTKAVDRFSGLYLKSFRRHFAFADVFPIIESYRSQRLKYYLLFATRSPKAFELMSDCMACTFEELREELSRELAKGTIFDGELTDDALRVVSPRRELNKVLYELITRLPNAKMDGAKFNRGQIRHLTYTQYFGHYTNSEINKTFKSLMATGIFCTLDGKTAINDTTDLIFKR